MFKLKICCTCSHLFISEISNRSIGGILILWGKLMDVERTVSLGRTVSLERTISLVTWKRRTNQQTKTIAPSSQMAEELHRGKLSGNPLCYFFTLYERNIARHTLKSVNIDRIGTQD